MNEDKPRKLVYVEKHSEPDPVFDGDMVWYECPECKQRFRWLGRSEGGRKRFCPGCGNYLSWAKLDYENYKQTDLSFDKDMPFYKFLQDPRYGHTWEDEVSMTYSQSEKQILEGCIALMHELCGYFQEYLEYIGYEPDPEEEGATYFGMTYFHIVKRLFLWHTSHSGGTSTRMKCRCLGIDDSGRSVSFNFWENKETEEEVNYDN